MTTLEIPVTNHGLNGKEKGVLTAMVALGLGLVLSSIHDFSPPGVSFPASDMIYAPAAGAGGSAGASGASGSAGSAGS